MSPHGDERCEDGKAAARRRAGAWIALRATARVGPARYPMPCRRPIVVAVIPRG
ncbi:hypothetical protein LC55x_3144 [Lysobacter capsici]|nr:hypothetical protein LC55x_3144 [Lysobacter capsici]